VKARSWAALLRGGVFNVSMSWRVPTAAAACALSPPSRTPPLALSSPASASRSGRATWCDAAHAVIN